MPNIHILIEAEKFNPQVKYTFQTLFSILGFSGYTFKPEGAELTIFFGNNSPDLKTPFLWIKPSPLFWDNYGQKDSIPEKITRLDDKIPCIYAKNNESSPKIKISANSIESDLDIIASAFFMLSRYEEYYQPKKLDEHHRFPAQESLAHKFNFLNKPVVNMYAGLLKEWIEKLLPGICQWKQNHWAGKDLAFCMTHDIDTISGKKWYDTIKDDIKNILRGKITGLLEFLLHNFQFLSGNNPGNNFPFLAKLAEQFDLQSTYFFMAENRDPKYDMNEYKLNSPETRELIDKLQKAGQEIALHCSYDSYDSGVLMREEADQVAQVKGKKEIGMRCHYLRLTIPDTFQAQASVQIDYDSTLGYADQEGFRAGICHPFQPYDLQKNEVIPLWEIPLIWMEGSLLNYQKLSVPETLESFKYYLRMIAEYHGVFVALFHNTIFSHQEMRKLYSACLQEVGKTNSLNVTLSRCLQLYKNQLY